MDSSFGLLCSVPYIPLPNHSRRISITIETEFILLLENYEAICPSEHLYARDWLLYHDLFHPSDDVSLIWS